jgi:cytochrome b6-f complex iron-sulfur subunit
MADEGGDQGGGPGGAKLGRRDFLANAVLGVAAVLGFGTLGERFLAFLYPVVPPERDVEFDVAARDAIPKGGGTIASTPFGHIALLDQGGEIRAFSAVCTHLGCIIKYDPGPGRTWFCPCHKGTYDAAGKVVSGPPPRPLPSFPATVRDGRVFVKMRVRPRVETT